MCRASPTGTDDVAYALTLDGQVEEGIETPTAELHQMCLDLVDEAVKSERLMTQLDIPEKLRDYVADSWKRGDPSLYGRFDFAYDGSGPAKLYEYNADTPTSIYESGGLPVAVAGGPDRRRLDPGRRRPVQQPS